MPDIQQLSVTPIQTAAVQAGSVVVLTQTIVNALTAAQKAALQPLIVPDVHIVCQVTDSSTGEVLADFSAGFDFLNAYRQLSDAARTELITDLLFKFLRRKAGVLP